MIPNPRIRVPEYTSSPAREYGYQTTTVPTQSLRGSAYRNSGSRVITEPPSFENGSRRILENPKIRNYTYSANQLNRVRSEELMSQFGRNSRNHVDVRRTPT